jgi:Flp pilus assembly protein TadG
MNAVNLLMKRTIRRMGGGEVGAAILEAALTAPLLIFMLLGLVEFGRVAYIAMETTNAAKAAVAYGSQNQITATDQLGMQKAAQLEATGLASQNVTLAVSATPACSCSSPDTTVAPFSCVDASTASCPSPSYVEQTINVTVTATFQPLIRAGNFPGTFTLTGNASQKRLN